MGEGGGQIAVGVGLGEQSIRLALESLKRVSACGESSGRFLEFGELYDRVGELGWIAALFAIHAAPCSDGLSGALGVVVDGGLRVSGGLSGKQLGAEKTGFDQHRADAEGSDLRGERLNPSFDAKFCSGTCSAEYLAGDAGGRGESKEQAGALPGTQMRVRLIKRTTA